MQIVDIEPETLTSEWARARYTGIGGSEAAAAIGVSKWTSPFTLYCRKKGLVEDDQENAFMYWGRILERPILEWFADTSEMVVFSNAEVARFVNRGEIHDPTDELLNEIVGRLNNACELTCAMHDDTDVLFLRSRTHGFIIGTPDGFAYDRGTGEWSVVEVKNQSWHRLKEWKEGVPNEYVVQMQHYLMLTGLEIGFFSVLFGGNTPGWMQIDADKTAQRELLFGVAAFWERLTTDTPPDPDGSDSTYHTLQSVYPVPNDATIELPPEALQWDREYKEAAEAEKYHTMMKKAAKTKIAAAMGAAKKGVFPDGSGWTSWEVKEAIIPETMRKGYRNYRRVNAPKGGR